MSRKYDTKRRKKWNRRILILKTMQDITLTRVKLQNSNIWISTQDLIDCWSSKRKARKRNTVTPNELTNRMKIIASQSFIETRHVDVSGNNGRYRRLAYKIIDSKGLNEYLEYCEKMKLEI